MLRTFQVNDKWKPFYTKAALFEGICEEDPVKTCQDGRVVDLRSSVDWEMASDEEFGFSGLLVGAWVRIPLLACFQFSLIGKQESSLELMPTCSPLRVQATDATLLSRTSGSSNCWLFSAKTWPGFTKSKQLRMIGFLCKSKLPIWTFLCSTLQDSGFSTLKGLFVLTLIR